MYTQIFTKLSQAKKSGQKDIIKNALVFLVSEIETVLELSDEVLKDKLPFSEFVEDSKFIFGVDGQSIFNEKEADMDVSTDGLVTELFNICHLPNGKEISDNLRSAILDVHSKFSRGVSENKLEIKKLRSVLDNIKDKIS